MFRRWFGRLKFLFSVYDTAVRLVWIVMNNLILFNKPYHVLSQFTDEGTNRQTLSHFFNSPQYKGFYAAGRLDYDSEGLLLLTNNGTLQHRISSPLFKLPKTYWVQVEGLASAQQVQNLCDGVLLKDGPTQPAKVRVLAEPPLWQRDPPIRKREAIPTQWLELVIAEGRNRQVRRMTAAVNLPTLRLVRTAIGDWTINNLLPGEHRMEQVHLPKQTNGANSTGVRKHYVKRYKK